MELASMLAGEPFSDNPRSVSPVIAAFLRAYNDKVDHQRRERLYEYAARTIGTRDHNAIERQRVEHCLDWYRTNRRRNLRFWLHRRLALMNAPSWTTAGAFAGELAAQACDDKEALGLLDELIALGQTSPEQDTHRYELTPPDHLLASSEQLPGAIGTQMRWPSSALRQ